MVVRQKIFILDKSIFPARPAVRGARISAPALSRCPGFLDDFAQGRLPALG